MEDKCLKCGKCCYFRIKTDMEIIETNRKCEFLKDNLCSVYKNRPEWCMTAEQMIKNNFLPEKCGYK